MTGDLHRRDFLTRAPLLSAAPPSVSGSRDMGPGDVDEPISPDAAGKATEAFRDERQHGVANVPQAFATWVSFDLRPDVDRAALTRLMRIWTDDIERLTSGRPGLTDARPAWLAPLPAFSIDRLEARWSGGDLLVQVCADDALAVAHATRLLTKEASTFVSHRWTQQGFRPVPGTTRPGTTMRNLMGQVDGSRNLGPGSDAQLIGHDSTADEWLVDRTGREFTIGRRLSDGAPLTGNREHDERDLGARDTLGLPVIDMAAHLRRARTADPAARLLRRGYNFHGPAGDSGRTSGLVFVTSQRDVLTQHLPVQRRIDELDLLNRWTTPVRSAVFVIPGGPRTGEFLGQRPLG